MWFKLSVSMLACFAMALPSGFAQESRGGVEQGEQAPLQGWVLVNGLQVETDRSPEDRGAFSPPSAKSETRKIILDRPEPGSLGPGQGLVLYFTPRVGVDVLSTLYRVQIEQNGVTQELQIEKNLLGLNIALGKKSHGAAWGFLPVDLTQLALQPGEVNVRVILGDIVSNTEQFRISSNNRAPELFKTVIDTKTTDSTRVLVLGFGFATQLPGGSASLRNIVRIRDGKQTDEIELDASDSSTFGIFGTNRGSDSRLKTGVPYVGFDVPVGFRPGKNVLVSVATELNGVRSDFSAPVTLEKK